MTATLQPDRPATEALVDALFRYASPEAFISLRAFHDLEDGRAPLFVEPVKVNAPDLLDRVCVRMAEAANTDEPYVFCSPLCTFSAANGGKFEDLAEGLCLTVECDKNPRAALARLTEVLGDPTCVVRSGGVWINPATGEPEDKLHLHWRLSEPAADAETFEHLKEARKLAADLVDADRSAVSIVHPLRWPGSWHRKNPERPRLARIETKADTEIELIPALERLRGLCPGHRANGDHKCNEQLQAPLGEIEAALNALPNEDLDWDSWNRIGMAAWNASGGAAFAAFERWSQKSAKYDAATTAARWDHYATSPPDRIGAGTIFYEADRQAPGWHHSQIDGKGNDALLAELAALTNLEYDCRRKEEAIKLGVRLDTLDAAVEELRAKNEASEELLPHWNVEPWPEEVDGDALLDDLQRYFRRYLVLPAHADVALALWTLNTWVFDCFDITPYLAITSPTRRCGKTALMTLLYWLCRRGKKSDYISRAAIYRSVERDKPTLILDEVSWVLDPKDDRQGILCGGFERNGYVEICEGEAAAMTTRLFSTYCPKAFGLIGSLTPTLTDRSIVIRMRRKTPTETVERLRRRDNDEHARFRQQFLRWAQDNAAALAAAPAAVLDKLNDRAADFWEPLLIIASQAGGEWPERALHAALALSGDHEVDDDTIGVELLNDCKTVFEALDVAELPTKALIHALCKNEERPWATYARGDPIKDRQLAKLLKAFGIISGTVHPPGGSDAKGYKRTQFKDAWERYL